MKQVMVVDDSLVNRMYIKKLLGDDYDVICAGSGKEMFEILEQIEPHLILLDIIMPELDGFAIIEKLKASDEYHNIPVIFITGLGDEDSEEKGLKLGAIDYISKPFKESIVKARVNAYVKLYEFVKQVELAGQRDGLTRLYNKKTTEQLIKKFLTSDNMKNGALMIIDVDNFKTINDTFGHLYGDAVLAQLSEALKDIFQKSDIIGRVGGDEFFVFLKNYKSKEVLEERAKAVCEKFKKTYEQKDQKVNISASIGIATTEETEDFEQIYENSDVALYNTKAGGKDGYTFFTGEEKSQYKSTRTQIETDGKAKNFKNNFKEYVFSLLYSTKDFENAVNSVLRLICEQYNFENAGVVKFGYEDQKISRIYSWNINDKQKLAEDDKKTLEELLKLHQLFNKDDFTIVEAEQGSNRKYMFALRCSSLLWGYICFEQTEENTAKWKEDTAAIIMEICQVLSVFLHNNFLIQTTLEQKIHSLAVLEAVSMPVYVVDAKTMRLHYLNGAARDKVINTRGLTCYKKLYNKDEQCKDCPLLEEGDHSIATKEISWNNSTKAFVVSGYLES